MGFALGQKQSVSTNRNLRGRTRTSPAQGTYIGFALGQTHTVFGRNEIEVRSRQNTVSACWGPFRDELTLSFSGFWMWSWPRALLCLCVRTPKTIFFFSWKRVRVSALSSAHRPPHSFGASSILSFLQNCPPLSPEPRIHPSVLRTYHEIHNSAGPGADTRYIHLFWCDRILLGICDRILLGFRLGSA